MAFEVTTKDGDEYQGYKLREEQQRIVLGTFCRTRKSRFALTTSKARKTIGSLMPLGMGGTA